MSPHTIEDWLQRIRLGEDTSFEFKRVVFRGASAIEGPHPGGLADEFAAMANAAGGTLILGVDDKTREIIGIPSAWLDTVEEWLSAICNDRIKPPLDIQTSHIELPDSTGQLQPVIVVKVPRSLWVHQSPNGYFKRVGHAKRQMTPDVLARLFQQRSQARLIRFEEQAVPNSRFEDLDPLLIRSFIRDGEGSAEQQLQRLHLLASEETENGWSQRLSVAGVLLGTVKPVRWLPAAYIQAVAYRGVVNDPAEQLDAKDFDGPLQQQIWDAFGFVKRHMLVPATKDLGRRDYPQYSLRAVFEAIVNAVAHRDYAMDSNRIRLFMFADRLELSVPGALPNSMTIEAMTAMSLPRNDVLCSLFSRYFPMQEAGLGRETLMDKRGAGVDLILAESKRLSGKSAFYENIADMELRLTIFAAAGVNKND